MGDESLAGWMRALIAYVRSGEPDLTNRQMALLMLVYLTPGPHTVRGLAKVLGVSKPVVTRALNTLGALGYLRRERDQDDRRNVFVVRTSNGADFLEGFKRNLRESDRVACLPPANHRTTARLRASALTNSRFPDGRTRPIRSPTLTARTWPTSPSPGESSRPTMPSRSERRWSPARRFVLLPPTMRRSLRNSSRTTRSACSTTLWAGPGATPVGTGSWVTCGPRRSAPSYISPR